MAKTKAELEAELNARAAQNINELNDWVERSDMDRILVEKERSLVNVLDDAPLLECEKFKKQFVSCMFEKGSNEECRHEFLLYALCKMKKETPTISSS